MNHVPLSQRIPTSLSRGITLLSALAMLAAAPCATAALTSSTVHQGTDEIVTFTSGSGTWTVPAGVTSVNYLVVGGGGGGGGQTGGGGGAGGFLNGTITVTAGSGYTVTVGAGGPGGTNAAPYKGSMGGSSVFGATTANGGGGGGSNNPPGNFTAPDTGGSGGGGSGANGTAGAPGTSLQGNAGGACSNWSSQYGTGGGGGAGAGGANGSATGGNGGTGLSSSITGSTVWYTGGGAGGCFNNAGGTGGQGGGGNGGSAGGTATASLSATANTGGGGGGQGGNSGTRAGSGGSGVVIVRYAYGPTSGTLAWTNTASGAWSDAANWSGSTVPVSTGQADYTLNFNTAGTYTATNNLGSSFLLNQLNFDDPTVTLAGNSLEFTGTTPQVNQNSASAVTVGNNLILDAATTVGGSGNGTVMLTGAISGAGSLSKTGNSTLTLGGAGTYDGATALNGGTLKLAYNASIPVNDSSFENATGLSNNTNYRASTTPGGNLAFNTPWTPTGSSWTFQNYAGLAKGNGGWSLPTEPDGTQCAVLQNASAGNAPKAYQTLSFPRPGTYTATVKSCYSAAGGQGGQAVTLWFNTSNGAGGTNAGSFTPASNSVWNTYSLSFDVPAAGNYEVCFQMNGTANNSISAIDQMVIAGTLNGSLPANSALAIAAGATFDVSDITAYSLGSGASLSASGTGASPTTIKGGTSVSLGSQAVTLNFTPTSFTGDTANPALSLSQGALTLNGAITVHIGGSTPLGAGSYRLISQASGSISGAPTLAATTGPGSHNGLAGSMSAFLQVSGAEVNLVVASNIIPPTVAVTRHGGTLDSTTYGDALSFNVAVTPTATPPTGLVTLKDGGAGGTTIGTHTLVAGDNGACTIPAALNALTAGSHDNIVALYAGDANFTSGVSAALSPAQEVAQKELTIAGAAAPNKIVDGTTTATLSGTLAGVLDGDTVTLNLAAHFASAAVGIQDVISTSAIGGASQANYVLTQPTGLTAEILSGATWTGATDSHWSATETGNWLYGLIAGQPNNVIFDSNTVNGTVLLDRFMIEGSFNLNSGLAHDITLDYGADHYPIIQNAGGITIAADSKDLTVNPHYALWGNVTWDIGAGRTLTMNGNVHSTYGITKNGPGTVVMTNANSYGGVTTINSGTLVAANNTALGTGGFNGATMTYVRDGATLALQGGITVGEHFHIAGSGVGGLGAIRSLSGNNSLTTNFTLDTNATIGVDADTLTISSIIYNNGPFGITKVGAGTLALSGANTYPGDTIVRAGTLAVNGSSIADTGKLVIDGGIADVAASANETVSTLYFGATQQAAGTYGSTTSSATHQDDSRFSGTGIVTVTTGPAIDYATWAHAYAGDGAPHEDFNHDGVANGVAFFMGMNGLATNPGVVGGMVTWPHLNEVSSFDVQVSDNLVDWESASPLDIGGTPPPNGHVNYTLPTGPSITKKFCRLLVVP